MFEITLTLFLAARAAARLNTLALAGLLLASLFLSIVFAALTIRAIGMSVLAKLAIVIVALLRCVMLDHLLHAHAALDDQCRKTAVRAMSTPPLMLLFNPRELHERQTLTPLKEGGLSVSSRLLP